MSTKTAIQWTDVTDNIIVVEGGGWWCRKISPGCANCYAAKLNQSDYFGGNKLAYSGARPNLKLRRDLIDGWKRQRHPKKHFVASMTDVFGEWVAYGWVDEFLTGMMEAPQQTFQVLTKRPDVARRQIEKFLAQHGLSRLPGNIWIGTSVENQEYADKRIPELVQIPAATRFLSVEPLIGKLDLRYSCFNGADAIEGLCGIDWVIVGGESGPGARPCDLTWIRIIVGDCQRAKIACFVKQIGRDPQWSDKDMDEHWYERFSHPKGGNMEEWPADIRVRQFPFAFKEV